jgi:hypothetical protein
VMARRSARRPGRGAPSRRAWARAVARQTRIVKLPKESQPRTNIC